MWHCVVVFINDMSHGNLVPLDPRSQIAAIEMLVASVNMPLV